MDIVHFKNRTDIKTYNLKKYMPGAAINKGVKYATRDYILVLSGHTQIIEVDFKSVMNDLNKSFFGKQIPVHKGKKITPGYIWTNFNDKPEFNKSQLWKTDYFLDNAFVFTQEILN